jgi:hypothetical protein
MESPRDRRKVVAGTSLAFGVVAAVVLSLQTRTAECNWASPIGSFDSAHAFKEGSGVSGWLFLGCTVLFTAAAIVALDRFWIRILLAPLVWLVVVVVLFGVLASQNPCHMSKEPSAAVVCGGDDWRNHDRDAYSEDGTVASREECLRYSARAACPGRSPRRDCGASRRSD